MTKYYAQLIVDGKMVKRVYPSAEERRNDVTKALRDGAAYSDEWEEIDGVHQLTPLEQLQENLRRSMKAHLC